MMVDGYVSEYGREIDNESSLVIITNYHESYDQSSSIHCMNQLTVGICNHDYS